VKRAVMRAPARQDWRDEVRYCRREAGSEVANRLADRLQKSVRDIEVNPSIGSLLRGDELGIVGLRARLVDGVPLALWYFEREELVDIVRIVGQRQDAMGVDVDMQ
jgi:plasmid stabilization system protein ParE